MFDEFGPFRMWRGDDPFKAVRSYHKALFSKPKMPKVEAPARMPDPEDPAALEARRRRVAEMAARGGRQSTILSDNLTGSKGMVGA